MGDKTLIRQAFEAMDADDSGTLDREEVRSLIAMMGKRLTDAELDEAMKELDGDGSGEIDFREFSIYWDANFATGPALLQGIISNFAKIKPITGAEAAFHPDRYIEKDEALRARVFSLFSRIEKDGDKVLDYLELADYLDSKGEQLPRPQVEAAFKEHDTNGQGTCDADELVGVLRSLDLLRIVPSVEETALHEMQVRTKAMRRRREENPALYSNPVWEQSFDLGVEVAEDDVEYLKRMFAMADIAHVGFLGRRQFLDLIQMLGIEADAATTETMFRDMDADGNGQIEFPEFVRSMVSHIGLDTVEEVVTTVEMGAQGTRKWTRGEIHWAANTGLLLISTGVIIAGLRHFNFILVPLATAYFVTFLLAPAMDWLEHRPLPLEIPKPPHGIVVLLTVAMTVVFFLALAMMVLFSLTDLLDDAQFVARLDAFQEDMYTEIDLAFGLVRDLDPRWTQAELQASIDAITSAASTVSLYAIMTIYIMLEKTDVAMFTGETMSEIEQQIKSYISVKMAISFATGAAVAAILFLLSVKMAVLFGILSFVLNFIPNIGSMLAIALPLPVVVVDPNLEDWQKALAFIGPGFVQLYVGNVLEPMVLGKSLNMTPMSILAALVIWGSIWGIMGAILSVPMLAIMKILLTKANHPLAKTSLLLIREDATIDENDPDNGQAKRLQAERDAQGVKGTCLERQMFAFQQKKQGWDARRQEKQAQKAEKMEADLAAQREEEEQFAMSNPLQGMRASEGASPSGKDEGDKVEPEPEPEPEPERKRNADSPDNFE